MRQAGVAEKAVDHLLVTETFAGPDHIDYQGERNGQRQFAVSGEILTAEEGVDILPVLRKKSRNEFQRIICFIFAVITASWREIFTATSLPKISFINFSL